jgi:hypothetical protein
VWIVRGVIILIGVIALLWLGTINAGTRIDFRFFIWRYLDIELNIILVITFIAGMLVWAVGAWIREVQLTLRLTKTRKTIQKLQQELADLRNLPLVEEADTLDEPRF